MQIHFDGKSVKNLTGRKLVERLPVKAMCDGREQVLGCPTTGRNGHEVAQTVYNRIIDWEIEDHVVSICFDTTRVNSGRVKGAAVILERLLGKSLHFMPCRHHIYELILILVYEHHMGATQAPTVILFGRFEEVWETLDKQKYVPGIVDSIISKSLPLAVRESVKVFVKSKMNKVKIQVKILLLGQ